MVFNSAVFIFFAVIVLFIYYLLGQFEHGKKFQNRFLLVASYYFYGYWDWVFLGLIVISTFTDYFVALGIEAFDNGTDAGNRRRKQLLWTSMLVNLGLLGAFKYYDFFIESFVLMTQSISPEFFQDGGSSLLLRVTLPVGISFYTFQTMSYTIDVYRRVIRAERSLPDFALFVCFFPQLVAGPIERAGDLMPALKGVRKIRIQDIEKGFWLLLLGFYMKTYVADNLGSLVDMVYLAGKGVYASNPELAAGHDGSHVFASSIAFTFQIYCDFAGYSFIAMGIARLLGIKLSQNFNSPEFSKSPDELWKRWHITLGRWVQDYIYIPLGGSRMGEFRKHWNLFVTFVLMGFWHGANWTFVLWGAYQGAWIAIAGIMKERREPLEKHLQGFARSGVLVSKRMAVFLGFAITATLFRAYDLHHSILLWKSMFTLPWTGSSIYPGVPEISSYAGDIFKKLAILIVIDYMAFKKNSIYWIFEQKTWIRVIVYTVLFYQIVIQGVFGKDVIYFAF